MYFKFYSSVFANLKKKKAELAHTQIGNSQIFDIDDYTYCIFVILPF